MRRLVLSVLLVAATVLVASPAGALACPNGVGGLGDSELSAGICVPGGNASTAPSGEVITGSGGEHTSSGGRGEPSPYVWERSYPSEYSPATRTVFDPVTGIPSVAPSPAPECTGPNGEPGRPYRDTLTDTRTGELISAGSGCELPGQAGAGNGAPVPPPPPSAGEVINAAPLPKLPFALSPAGRNCSPASTSPGPANPAPPCAAGEAPGLTGLETLLWVEPPPPPEASVTVSIRGYTVTTRAHPVRYEWEMRQPGDTESTRNPDPTFSADRPGTRAAPAARYRWETKGDYRISLSVVWEGSYTFSGFGVSRTEALGPVTGTPTIVPYHVIEIRARRPTAPCSEAAPPPRRWSSGRSHPAAVTPAPRAGVRVLGLRVQFVVRRHGCSGGRGIAEGCRNALRRTMTMPTRSEHMPPSVYRLGSSRWRPALMFAALAWVAGAFAFSRLLSGLLGAAVGLLVAAGLFLLLAGAAACGPVTTVKLDADGLVLDFKRVAWTNLGRLTLREKLLGWQLRAVGVDGSSAGVTQFMVPAPLADVVAEIRARAPSPLVVDRLPASLAGRLGRPGRIILVVVCFVGALRGLNLPAVAFEGPGTPEPVAARITGAPERSGALLVLAVESGNATPYRVLRGLLDDAVDLHLQSVAETQRAYADTTGRDQRERAEDAALAAAAACLGRPVAVDGGHVVVTTPIGQLQAGDRVLAAGGHSVRFLEDIFAAAADAGVGADLLIEASAPDGVLHSATVPVGVDEGTPRPLGIGLTSAPMQLGPTTLAGAVDLRGLSGGSAGLASALGLVDAFGPEAVAAGRRIAVTGTIDPHGAVGPIAGLKYKVAMARRHGAELLVVPTSQADFARRYAGELSVIGVDSLDQALRALDGPGCADAPAGP